MTKSILVVLFAIQMSSNLFGQNEVLLKALDAYKIDGVFSIDSLGSGYYIVSTFGDKKARTFLLTENRSGYNVQLLDMNNEYYSQMHNYFMSNQKIYVIRTKLGSKSKGISNKIFFDKLEGIKFVESKNPVFETMNPIGRNKIILNNKLCIFFKGKIETNKGHTEKPENTKNTLRHINVVQFDLDDLNNVQFFKSELSEDNSKSNLYEELFIQNENFIVLNVLKRNEREFDVLERKHTNTGYEERLFSGKFNFEMSRIITLHNVGNKYYVLAMDTQLNFHGFLMELNSGEIEIISEVELPYEQFVIDYEPEVLKEKKSRSSFDSWMGRCFSDNVDNMVEKEHFVTTGIIYQHQNKEGGISTFLTHLVIAKIEGDELSWISNVAQSYNVFYELKLGLGYSLTNALKMSNYPKMSFNDDFLIIENRENSTYCKTGKFLFRPVAYTFSGKYIDFEIYLNREDGKITRKMLKEAK